MVITFNKNGSVVKSMILSLSSLILSLISLGLASSAQASLQNEDPRFLIHLLDYLAKDYGGAVQDGKVVSDGEYKEQVEFSGKTLEIAQRLGLETKAPETHKRLTELAAAIHGKASADTVASLARDIQGDVLTISKLEMAPNTWPNVANGKKLFAEQCAMCHGTTGRGDGPAGVNLDPAPADFHSEGMAETSPFQEFNVIRLGVPGTGMPPFENFSQDEIWDLAFYVVAMRHEAVNVDVKGATDPLGGNWGLETLKAVATGSDAKLLTALNGSDAEKTNALALLRRHQPDETQAGMASLTVARTKLGNAVKAYESGDIETAKSEALGAYLDGVEPVEARIQASDAALVIAIEESMMEFRDVIAKGAERNVVDAIHADALKHLDKAETLLSQTSNSPQVAFVAASAIILREGFEAFLVVLALLGVVRASGSKRAAMWVHGGWVSAVAVGVVLWFVSGSLLEISGASREIMEGAVALLAVVVLISVGFWMHSQTEITRWKHFIEGRVKEALRTQNLAGLAIIAFVAVFREALETVLFLRAVWIEGGASSKTAMLGGVIVSAVLILVLARVALRYSVKLPLRKLFGVSSVIMAVLAVILTGKGLRALQEAGSIAATTLPFKFRIDLFGIFPTRETLLAQLLVLAVIAILWMYGRKPQQAVQVSPSHRA